MADEKVGVRIVVDTSDGQKQTEKLGDKVEGLDKATKNAEKSAKKTGGAFSSLGSVLKTLGVVAIIDKAFSFLKDTFNKNQKVADTMTAIFDTLATILNTLITIVIDVTSQVSKSSNGFAALGKVMMGLLTLVLTPVKLIFYELKLAVQAVQLAWEKSFFGKNDPKAILELQEGIRDTTEAIIEVGKNAIKAGKDVYNNFGEAAKSVGDLVSGVVDKASKMNVKAMYEHSKATIAMKNNAKIAEAELANLVEKYDRQAEQLRQVRDDETKSIDERIAANQELGKVLDDQEKAMIAQVQKKVEAAKAELAQNKENKDLQVALIQAQGEVEAVKAKVAGLRSEQLVNQNNLLKEQIAINKAVSESDNQLSLDKKKANAELIKDDIERLNAKRKILDEESAIELKRLQDNINNTKAGTAARAEAEIAYNQKKQELDIQAMQMDDQISVASLNRELERLGKLRTEQGVAYEERVSSLDLEKQTLDAAFEQKLISERDYNAKVKELTNQRMAFQEAELQAKLEFANAVGNVMGQLAGLFQQGTTASKIAGLAEIAIGTGTGFINALSIAQKSAKGTGAAAAFAFPIFYATQVAAVLGAAAKAKQILTQVKGGGASSSNITPPSIKTAAPIIPQAPEPTTTTLDQQSINQLGSATTRAYVVESDIANSQERITRISRAARLV